MFPKTLALLNQAFRVDVRQLRTHLLRGAVASGVLWILAIVHEGIRWTPAPGLEFFTVLSWLSLVLLSLAGAFYFSSVITEEKEQQTLGLLRMAGVGPGTLLVGKSLGRLSVVLLLMTITLPYWWLAVTLGGVTLTQVAAGGVVLATHLIVVSQIGTLCSVIFRTTGPAAVAASLTIAALMFGPLVLYEILREFHVSPIILQAVRDSYRWLAPGQLEFTLRSGYADGLIEIQAVSNVAAAALLFGTSWLLFDRFNTYDLLEGAGTPLWRRWLERIQAWPRTPSMLVSQRRRPRRATGNAIVWKDFRQFAGGWKWWILRTSVFGVCALGYVLLIWANWSGRDSYYYGNFSQFWGWEVGLPLMGWMTFFAALEAAYLAGHIFHRELNEQTWDSLRMLPISLRALCGWKIVGCCLALAPAVAFFLLGFVIDMADWGEIFDEFTESPVNFTFAAAYFAIATIFALYLICFFSLKTNPWLGLVLAAAAFGFTVFSGFFCCFEIFDMDDWDIAFIVFWGQSLIASLLILFLHIQIMRMLRGDNAAG